MLTFKIPNVFLLQTSQVQLHNFAKNISNYFDVQTFATKANFAKLKVKRKLKNTHSRDHYQQYLNECTSIASIKYSGTIEFAMHQKCAKQLFTNKIAAVSK